MTAKKRDGKKSYLTCGTRTAFEAHLRRNERPCSRCLPFVDTYDDDEIITLRQELSDKKREQALWDNYGITLETFQRILAEQGHRCACCGSRHSGNVSWSIDHDPDTGKIRGILCSNCNSGIGLLGDKLTGIRQAETYLLAHEKRGGHPKDRTPPQRREVTPKISKRMRRCFHYLSQGLPSDKIVVLLRMVPDTVTGLERLWTQRGRPFVEDDSHVLEMLQEPFGFGCTCGFESPVLDHDRIQDAIELVNDHIDAAKAAESARIATGQLTEQERLSAVEQERSRTAAQARLRQMEQEHLRIIEQERVNACEEKREEAIASKRQADKARQPALRKLEEIYFQFLDNHDGDRDLLLNAMQAADATQNDINQISYNYVELKNGRKRIIHRVRINQEDAQIECTCGYVVTYDSNDKDSIAAAVDCINVHTRDCFKVSRPLIGGAE